MKQALLDTDADTFFSGIRQLPAGHFVVGTPLDFVKGRVEPKRYWRLPPPSAPESEAALIEQVRETFLDAVKIRLRSDVPVGNSALGRLRLLGDRGRRSSAASRAQRHQARLSGR